MKKILLIAALAIMAMTAIAPAHAGDGGLFGPLNKLAEGVFDVLSSKKGEAATAAPAETTPAPAGGAIASSGFMPLPKPGTPGPDEGPAAEQAAAPAENTPTERSGVSGAASALAAHARRDIGCLGSLLGGDTPEGGCETRRSDISAFPEGGGR